MKSKVSIFSSVLGRRILKQSLLYGFILVIIVTGAQIFLEYQREVRQIHARIEQIYASNAQSLSASLWNLDRIQIRSQLHGIMQIPGIRFIKITSNDLEVITDGKLPATEKISREFDLTYNSDNETITLGKLIVNADYQDIYQRLWNSAGLILAGSLFIVAVIIILILYIMNRIVTRPLTEMAATFKDKKTRNFNQSVSVSRDLNNTDQDDEIDVLIEAINEMMAGLKNSHVYLEQQVKERTHELQIERNLFIAGNVVVFKWANKDGWPVEYVSPNVAEVLGYTADDFLGNKVRYTDIIPQQDIERVANEVMLATQSQLKHFTHQPYRVIRKDGKTIWLDDFSTILYDQNNKVRHYLGYVVDVTTRKIAETAIMQAKTEAEQANKAKSEFLSSMSHELRTPMNAILGFSQLIQIKTEDDTTREYIEEITRAGHHLLTLINEILDLSKIESGNLEVSLECVSLNTMLEDCMGLVSTLAEKNQVKIINNISSDADYTMNVDHTRFKQVLLNLLSNAIKYNLPQGSVTLSCTQPSSDRLRIFVADTGAGLNKAQLKKLFSSFERAGAESTGIEGTGIGLVITKRLIEMMGGCIGVDSEPGVGSNFWVEVNVSDRSGLLVAKEKSADDDPVEFQQGSKTILYIEDNPVNQVLVEQIIDTYTSYKLVLASDAPGGLIMAETHSPDMILMDINLPGMDGYEALKCLQENKLTEHIPVIAISANAMKTDLIKGSAAGFRDYLTKPIDIQQLMAAVKKWLKTADSKAV
ncbi:MAG: response regulator [Gammaproteobacteria bacterium]|nr:response regulator [Gammaproteobacteria bacterium]